MLEVCNCTYHHTGMQSPSNSTSNNTLTLTTSILKMILDASKLRLMLLLIFLDKCFDKHFFDTAISFQALTQY